MKLFLLTLVNLISINKAISQYVIEIKIDIGAKKRITKVDVEGNFSGADTAWRESIKKRLSTSTFKAKGAKRGQYTAKVRFIADKDGNISDVECVQDPGYGMCGESVRAVKGASKWGPGPVKRMKSTPVVDSLKVPG